MDDDRGDAAVQRSLAARARSVADHIAEAVYTLDPEWRFTYVNPVAARLLGRSGDDLLGCEVWSEFPDLADTQLAEVYHRVATTHEPATFEMYYPPVQRELTIRVYGDRFGLCIAFRDLQEQRLEREGEAATTALMGAVVDVLPASLVIMEKDGTILTTNRSWRQVSERIGRPDAFGSNYYDVVASTVSPASADHLRTVLAAVVDDASEPHDPVDLEAEIDDRRVWFQVQASPVPQTDLLVVTHTDVTSHVQARHTASWAARHDSLTRLANRAHLFDLLGDALRVADHRPVTLLFIDLDGFKAVNDEHGHDAGDDLLRLIAERLQANVRADDTVARLGGDEFVVLSHPAAPSDAHRLEERLRAAFVEPMPLNGGSVRVDISVGVASARPGEDARQLIRRADQAMYEDKRRRRGRA
jgi:diguanylate cyclase (GGDEF)-like protein/PAS domain S-box-containing protein